MPLASQVVDRLFARLGATYGVEFSRRYDGIDPDAVKASWAQELSGFDLHSLAWALENLPERSPNVIEFRAIARRAPAPDVKHLQEPSANPDRIKSEIERLRPVALLPRSDAKDWARRILQRQAAGEKINRCAYLFAKQVVTPEAV